MYYLIGGGFNSLSVSLLSNQCPVVVLLCSLLFCSFLLLPPTHSPLTSLFSAGRMVPTNILNSYTNHIVEMGKIFGASMRAIGKERNLAGDCTQEIFGGRWRKFGGRHMEFPFKFKFEKAVHSNFIRAAVVNIFGLLCTSYLLSP